MLKIHLKKAVLLCLFCCMAEVSLWSYGGYLSGTKGKLKVYETQYFDIIYPDECKESASKIAAVADDYYREIAAKLGYTPYQRFPVTLTKQVESVNAFFSMAPYNLIVLYDTDITDDVDMYDKSIEMLFYHELTHAVSLNSKHPFWRGMAVLGDLFTPAGLSLTSFWYEGATVSFESAGKGGRMNDPFFTQIVIEKKLKALCKQEVFSSWRDVTGARDIFPYGNDAYAFGACFAQYLQDTYGMEKYAEFWKRAGTLTTFTFCAGIFEHVYKNSLDFEWQKFYESIPVPEIDLTKRQSLMAHDNLMSYKDSVIKTADSWYDRENNTYHYAWFDSLSAAIFVDGKRTLCVTGVQTLRYSPDGKKLLVNRLVARDNIKSEDFELDLKTNRTKNLKHLRERFENVSGARIVKDGLNWSIEYEHNGNSVSYNLADRITHNLHLEHESESEVSYIFTWTKLIEGGLFKNKPVLTRAGRITINKSTLEAKVYFQTEDNFAGLIEVIKLDDGFGIVTEEYSSNPLRKVQLDFNNCETVVINGDRSGDDKTRKEKPVLISDETSHEYNPFFYYAKGVKLPVGLVPLYNHDMLQTSLACLGGTFVTTNPWTDNQLLVSGAWSPMDKFGGGTVRLSGGNSSRQQGISGSLVFDAYGFLQTTGTVTAEKVFYHGKVSTLSTGLTGNVFYGMDKNLSDEVKDDIQADDEIIYNDKNHLFTGGKFHMAFANLHRTKPGHGQYSGIVFKPFVDAEYNDIDDEYFNTGAQAQLHIPGPFPVSLTGTLFPKRGNLGSVVADVEIFDWEIQKGIPAISTYFHRLTVNTTYSGRVKYYNADSWDIKRTSEIVRNLEEDNYGCIVRVSANLTIGPNTSYLAGGTFQFNIGGGVQYQHNIGKKDGIVMGVFSNIAL